MKIDLKCQDVWSEISNYIDGAVDASLRNEIDAHLKGCKHCTAILDGARNVVRLVGDNKAFEVPVNLSRDLYSKLNQHLESAAGVSMAQGIPLGITSDRVGLGSHLLYFWESEADFERGVRFLTAGLGRREHGIAFGHEEALERVRSVLRAAGHDPERLVENKQLTILRRHASAQITLSDIDAVIQAALRAGSPAVRFLGNLGMGRDPLPAGEDDVVDLEHRVSAVIQKMPSVIVCMYDVRTLPGRLILKGGLEQHRLTVCADGVRENPYYHGEGHEPRLSRIN